MSVTLQLPSLNQEKKRVYTMGLVLATIVVCIVVIAQDQFGSYSPVPGKDSETVKKVGEAQISEKKEGELLDLYVTEFKEILKKHSVVFDNQVLTAQLKTALDEGLPKEPIALTLSGYFNQRNSFPPQRSSWLSEKNSFRAAITEC